MGLQPGRPQTGADAVTRQRGEVAEGLEAPSRERGRQGLGPLERRQRHRRQRRPLGSRRQHVHRRADPGGDRRRRTAAGDPDPSLQSDGASLTSKLLPDGRLVAEEATQASEVDMDQAGPGVFQSRGDSQAGFQQRVASGRLGIERGETAHEPGTAHRRVGIARAGPDTLGASPRIGLDHAGGRRCPGDDRQRLLAEHGLAALQGGGRERLHQDAGHARHAVHHKRSASVVAGAPCLRTR